jgi:hypothetical protein
MIAKREDSYNQADTERGGVDHRSSDVLLLLLTLQMCLSFMFMQLFFLLEALPTGLTLELLTKQRRKLH